MKILHTADWHLGNYVGPMCDSPMQRMKNTMNCLDVLVKTAKNEKPDVILVAGDIFHQARVWSDRALIEVQVAAKYLNQLGEIAPTVVLYGTPNHDGKQQFTTVSKMTSDQVNYFTEPHIIEVETFSGAIQIAGLPGFDKGHFRAQYPGLSAEEENIFFSQQLNAIIEGLSSQVAPGIPSVLMAHHTVVGSQLDNGQHVFQTNEVILEPATIDNSAFDIVCLGHIHKAQRVESCNKPVYYAGSIDSFSFNDEACPKGYWVHEILEKVPHFFETPYREFITERWDQEECQRAADMNFSIMGFEDKVVRVLYTCDSETEKALNKKQLEKDLYAAGAYYVSEIRPEKIHESVNKERMHESLAVEDCLKKYLEEKNYDSTAIPYWIEFAQPIILKVQASQPAGGQTGVFLPMEIAVRNYRSYAEEMLSFQDIHFAMVNGPNGSGKSSLFMDALVDCLYEQPREGELTGWIRSGEKSGSISFTFMLGTDTYRVTRTRQRSGKGTLALAKQLEQWEDISCERMYDTQQKIIDLLGMDADTFRSCVLIMQDQYGRFMEAKPEDRMSVLASLLGLGMYEQMETLAKESLRETNRELKNLKEDVSVLETEVSALENVKELEKDVKDKIEYNKEVVLKTKDALETVRTKLATIEIAEIELLQVERDIRRKSETQNEKQNKLSDLQRDMKATATFLESEHELTDAHDEYQKLQGELIVFGEQEKQARDKRQQMVELRNEIVSMEAEEQELTREIAELQARLETLPDMLDELNELNGIEHQLEELERKKVQLDDLSKERYSQSTEVRLAEEKVARIKRQAEMLQTVKCVDIERAQCAFLKEAKEAAEKIADAERDRDVRQEKLSDIEHKIVTLNYNPETYLKLTQQSKRYHELNQSIQACEADKRMIDIRGDRISSIEKSIEEKKVVRTRLNEELTLLEINFGRINTINLKLSELSEKEKQFTQLPAAKQYLDNAQKQIEDLRKDIDDAAAEIFELQKKKKTLQLDLKDADDIRQTKKSLEFEFDRLDGELSELMKQLGSIEEKLRELKEKQDKLKKIAKDVEGKAKRAARLQVLVEAFGQDGIPHQIIRDIVPELETSANEILGQMTGGRMRLEFRTERTLKSNKAKEVATLDIVIIDVDNGELPYLARSGGQKVRAALAVSFALAMVKASRVGLQLGMMFVDEPPFLDDEGTEAYCLALAAIHERYPDMRIVAISHDRYMKARFPQQITIVVSEGGSKVRWE